MTVRQRLEHGQRLVFTQTLQQSVRILELPILELKGVLENELAENPAMEETAPPASSADENQTPVRETPEDDNTSLYDKEFTPREFDGFENPLPGKKENLEDFLLRQLRINAKDENLLKSGIMLVQQIDENGYIRGDINILADAIQVSIEDVHKALSLIQTFDPPGVGARDLKECLLIQLKKNCQTDPLTVELIEKHLPELAEKNIEKLCKKLKCSQEELALSLAKIHSLEPKPGRSFSSEETPYVIPDIIIEEKDDKLLISIKDDVMPVVRVNPVYKNMLKSKKTNEKTKDFIRERILNANNLIRAIQSRKDTLLKVCGLIADTQKEAILEGIEKLKPLSLKEVALKCGIHESTVSRVVANKYVQAPAGIFPLKDLFSTGLKTSDGEDIASERIRHKISELVDEEDKSKPLKDHELTRIIQEDEKTTIARRTVAKYREALKIPPASKRRTH